MKNDRTLLELWKIILNRAEEIGFQKRGICWLLGCTFKAKEINREEYIRLKVFLTQKKPSKITKRIFYYSSLYNSESNDYWWKNNSEGNQERIKFIKSLITSCKFLKI